jgi:hypothetical protein
MQASNQMIPAATEVAPTVRVSHAAHAAIVRSLTWGVADVLIFTFVVVGASA